MLGFNAFKGIDNSLVDGLKSGQKISLGAHNSLLQLANKSVSYGTSAWAGAGAGAAYGAVDGAFSYDGSVLGGAFHGAMLGAGAGAGAKFAANTYAKGAVGLKSAAESNGIYSNAWTSAFKNSDGKEVNAFNTSAFKAGW